MQIKILNRKLELSFLPELKDYPDSHGYVNVDTGVINILYDGTTTPEQITETCLHEILHAICYLYNMPFDDDTEEITISLLARALMKFAQDNPRIMTINMNGDQP